MLTAIGKQSRFGEAYTRAVAAQAGFTFTPNSPDEDIFAIDATLDFDAGSVYVQIKTSSTIYPLEKDIPFPADQTWIDKWNCRIAPVYLIFVLLPKESESYLVHEERKTIMNGAHAYWHRLNDGEFAQSKTIHIPRSNRFTAATLETWRVEFSDIFSMGRKDGV